MKIPPMKDPDPINKSGNKRGWGKKQRKAQAEKVKASHELLASSIKTPREATTTGLPPPLKRNKIDLSDLARNDRTTARGRAAQQLVDITRILIQRAAEGLRLYEPLPVQADFHASHCRTRLVRGSNRAGKTLVAAVEVARAVTNTDPHKKYPKSGDVYIVSEQWGEIGRVIYPKLFMKGAFKVIRDKVTREIRAYKPWDPDDAARASEAKEAEPLIPKRMLAKPIAWHDKKLNQPEVVELKTGWRLHFFSGESKPPSGSAIDIAWLDEEIPEALWFVELNSRIAEREGVMIWTATPEIGTDQFHDYCQKAQEQILLPADLRDVEEYKMTLAENPHLSEKSKKGMASLLGDQDYEVRILGEFASTGRVIFPEYQRRTHCIDWFEVPKNWTHYAAIDPGHQVCAVLIGAVPDPADMVDRPDPFDLLLYDELYIPKCNAKMFAAAFEQKTRYFDFEDWVIDMHGARITDIGSGITVYEHYRAELEQLGVTCHRRGSGFGVGDDDIDGTIERARQLLSVNPMTGHPRLRVMAKLNDHGQFRPLLPNFDYELTRWKYKTVKGIVTSVPEDRGRVHQMANLRYLVGMKPKFVPQRRQPRSAFEDQIERMRRKAERQNIVPGAALRFGPVGLKA